MMGNYHVRFDGGFREKVSIQTTRPFTYPTMVVEVEVGGQPSLQLTHCVILVEITVQPNWWSSYIFNMRIRCVNHTLQGNSTFRCYGIGLNWEEQ